MAVRAVSVRPPLWVVVSLVSSPGASLTEGDFLRFDKPLGGRLTVSDQGILLPAGRIFKLLASLRCQVQGEGIGRFRWIVTTGEASVATTDALVGSAGPGASPAAGQSQAHAVVTTTTETTVQLCIATLETLRLLHAEGVADITEMS
ncbi:hypothetical protein [Azospirillum brasilense]|uniref:Uncharacterized protein n=1 Tax=Azospirillum brasilense TaxID=192 RepID=A0A6L3AWE2_AZOBR|nr:hypothetical protein [Azospirillum brasilense]KAA0682564.1 hypothetical protein DS837_20090 [Azospirillum brasilense]